METLLLIGVLATVFFAFIEFIKKKKQPKSQSQNQSTDDDKSSDNGSQDILSKFPAEALYHLKNAQDAELGNDYLAARVEYMACVDYLKRDKKAIPQIEFAKNEYAEFVRRDPIFNKMLPYFLEGIRQNQGILQSDITAKAEDMDWGELRNYNRTISKDDIRYVFYFAEEFGFLIRKKEGRSYRLYLPEQLKDVTEDKEKRKNDDKEAIEFAMMFRINKARAAVSEGDYETARYEYMRGVGVLARKNMRDEKIFSEYEDFARSDPGFKKLAEVFIAGIKDNPGITDGDIFVMDITKNWGEKYGYGKPIEHIDKKYFFDLGEKLGYITKVEKGNKVYIEIAESGV